MTGPEESHSSTQADIGRGVAGEERNDRRTAGRRAPPAPSRQHRAVTVAELTGEIPIVTDAHPHDAAEPATDELEEVRDDYTAPCPAMASPSTSRKTERRPGRRSTEEEADYAAHIEERDAEPLSSSRRARPHYAHAQRRYPAGSGVGAEEMSPDPVDVDDDDAVDAVAADLTQPAMAAATAPDTEDDADELPSYLRSSGGTLFGGETVADDLARRGDARR